MKLRRTAEGPVLHRDGRHLLLDDEWDDIFRRHDPVDHLRAVDGRAVDPGDPLSPIVGQEVWAAGVTYFVSRDARMEESEASGAADVYDRVYDATRPELFFKATGHRVVGPDQPVRVRGDSAWNIPEPELTLAISVEGRLFGYTIGNDMCSRDIEGENPLYIPQAKIYDGSAAMGPEILITDEPLAGDTGIAMDVRRDGAVVVEGQTEVSRIKRSFDELVDYLTRELTFPAGVFLMTGAGIVPPPEFTLQSGDVISITIDGIGTLTNRVA
ncbi:MAG: fumarylacetoacetate hydrolase family protein [Acidimicrobiia bacterium]|nr:fumarylacetoacetate hydrolase family protein [Acidimicrobiia bacterium]